MKVKEKAEIFIDKFLGYSYDGMSSARDNAIQCALICVSEKIESIELIEGYIDYNEFDEVLAYKNKLIKIKQELEDIV